MILFSIDSQKDDAKINITFSGLKDMLESKPIIGIHEIGKSNPKELNGTTINILLAKENDFAYTLFQGEGSIISFSQETVLIKFSGKAGSFTQANQPENWRNISGEIKIKYPITNLIQVDKKSPLLLTIKITINEKFCKSPIYPILDFWTYELFKKR